MLSRVKALCVRRCKRDTTTDALHGFVASPIAFISHESKQVVIQFLNIGR